MPYRALTIALKNRLPSIRSGVMSVVAPPCAKRDPLTKSAPLQRAATNRGISPGSVEPSASSATTMSPVQAANPSARALPFPRPVCVNVRTSRRKARATLTVRSVEWPSTTITSWRPEGEARKDVGQVLLLVQGRDHDADPQAELGEIGSSQQRDRLAASGGDRSRPVRDIEGDGARAFGVAVLDAYAPLCR